MRSKRYLALVIALLIGFGWPSRPVLADLTAFSFSYTADNTVVAWYQDGVLLPLGPNNTDWKRSDTLTINLDPGSSYQFVWNVEDKGYPGGFLGQITSNSSNAYSSSVWEVAYPIIKDGTGMPEWSTLTWMPATEYGANNDPSTVWYTYNSGPIAGIADEAQWIWTKHNWIDIGAPLPGEDVLFRVTMEPAVVPAPSALLLGAIGLGYAGRRLRRY